LGGKIISRQDLSQSHMHTDSPKAGVFRGRVCPAICNSKINCLFLHDTRWLEVDLL
jgi:hypothetical protein